MEALDAVLKRRSTRKYKDEVISDEQIHIILTAAMSAPSCVNSRDWEFIVVRNKDMLKKIADNQEGNGWMLPSASVAVVICGNTYKSYKHFPDYWIQDCAASAQNILTSAEILGLGGVWLGTYPEMSRVNGLIKLFGLPDCIIPFAVISLGVPEKKAEAPDRYDESKVHFEEWAQK